MPVLGVSSALRIVTRHGSEDMSYEERVRSLLRTDEGILHQQTLLYIGARERTQFLELFVDAKFRITVTWLSMWRIQQPLIPLRLLRQPHVRARGARCRRLAASVTTLMLWWCLLRRTLRSGTGIRFLVSSGRS